MISMPLSCVDPTKRNSLRMLGAAALWSLAGCRSQALGPLPVTAATSTTIDVHCHVFNARDLPIEGFVLDVIQADHPEWQLPATPLAWLLSLVMDADAIRAKAEADQIRGGRPARLADFQGRAAHTLSFPSPQVRTDVPVGSDEELVKQRVIDAVTRMQRPDAVSTTMRRTMGRLAPQAAPLPGNDEETLLRRLAARKPGQERLAAPAGTPERSTLAPIERVTPSEVADGVVATKDAVYGVFLMASLLTRPRAELTDRLALLPASDAADVSFFAPAMIDFSYWLNAQNGSTGALDVSSLKDQVDVMSAIAGMKQNSAAVHPWISFCPWRQIVEEGQLAIVQDAVTNKGFVGVKLYPVMGFRPYGNDGAPDPENYPPSLRSITNWGAKLDGALAALYDWCVANDVPIMAHCSFSQYPTRGAGSHGSPDAWKAVFQQSRWQNLRVNLAHVGGLWNMVPDDGSSPDGWTEEVVAMLATTPRLYADLGDYDRILERADHGSEIDLDKRTLGRLRDLLAARLSARARLMYGTDWVMLARCAAAERYYPSMKTHIPERLGLDAAQMQGFLGFNAAGFLGLAVDANGQKPQTRLRLEQFRRGQGLDVAILGRWDRVAATS